MEWNLTDALHHLDLDQARSSDDQRIYRFTKRRPDGVELILTVGALDDSVGVIVRWPGAAAALASASFEYVRSLRFLDRGGVIDIISGSTQHPTRCVLLLRAGTPIDIVAHAKRMDDIPRRSRSRRRRFARMCLRGRVCCRP